ncbi:MAG: SMC family ATPase [Chloroflexi bacterium]|nr:SMC family ATPase [Chloroflexota bacterium]
MLPISLKLRNFLSYREDVPTLHLENVHVACLCGANGHGKSALLDAMTWALWGRARGQRQEQLLHQGQQEMQVDLEFEVSGQRYKAVRRYSKTRRTGTSALDLHIWAGESYRPITGDTISATQAHIQRLINMDYETFVNSAFLLQGRADIFTMSTPAQRKEVLGKVLGLGLYDRLEDRAKAHARDANAALETAGAVMQRLQEQAAQKPEAKAAKEQSEAELATAQQLLTSLDGRLELLVKQITTLDQRRQEVQAQEDQRRQAAARAKEAEDEVVTLRTRLDGWREVLAREEQIAAGVQELTSARNRLTALQGAVQRVRELEGALHGHEQRIAGAKATLESDVRALERRVSQELAPIVESLPSLEASLGQAEQAVSAMGAESVELGMLQQRYQELVLEKRGLEEVNARIERGGKEIGAKIAMLGHSHQPDVACPLCGSALGPESMTRIESAYQEEIEAQREQYMAQTERIKALEIETAALETRVGEGQRTIEERRRTSDRQRAELTQRRDEAQRAQVQLVDAEAALIAVRAELEGERYAAENQAAALELRGQIAALDYSQEGHQQVETQAQELAPWEEEQRKLAEAKIRAPEDEVALSRAQAKFDQATQETARLDEALAQTAQELSELPQYQLQRKQVEEERRLAVQQRDALQSRLGSLTHQLDEIRKAEEELSQRNKERASLLQDASSYADLAQAFGKGGVQALLIEAAIPRLEDEANRLLHRMTDGRMSLKLETQRERRTAGASDDAIETLDILIADDIGTRSYELFSGGESFRINFALRIALSKLLAWRAGAPLPTLFIDEGFGTQDVEGRDRILDVLKSIEPDFQRILVITHMEEIKEAFPLRIEVTRTEAGSTFSLS